MAAPTPTPNPQHDVQWAQRVLADPKSSPKERNEAQMVLQQAGWTQQQIAQLQVSPVVPTSTPAATPAAGPPAPQATPSPDTTDYSAYANYGNPYAGPPVDWTKYPPFQPRAKEPEPVKAAQPDYRTNPPQAGVNTTTAQQAQAAAQNPVPAPAPTPGMVDSNGVPIIFDPRYPTTSGDAAMVSPDQAQVDSGLMMARELRRQAALGRFNQVGGIDFASGPDMVPLGATSGPAGEIIPFGGASHGTFPNDPYSGPGLAGQYYGDPAYKGSWLEQGGYNPTAASLLYKNLVNPQDQSDQNAFMRAFLEQTTGSPTAFNSDTTYQMMQAYPTLMMLDNPTLDPSQTQELVASGNFGKQMMTPGGAPVNAGQYWDKLTSPDMLQSTYFNPTSGGNGSTDATQLQIDRVKASAQAMQPFMSQEQAAMIQNNLMQAEAAYKDGLLKGDPQISQMSFLQYLDAIGASEWA